MMMMMEVMMVMEKVARCDWIPPCESLLTKSGFREMVIYSTFVIMHYCQNTK